VAHDGGGKSLSIAILIGITSCNTDSHLPRASGMVVVVVVAMIVMVVDGD
jgi:hypothetical protein